MNQVFLGFGVALLFGITTGAAIWWLEPNDIFKKYLEAYLVTFNCLLSGGLIIGTAIVVFKSQENIPQSIEAAFDEQALRETNYFDQKKKYLSLRRSLTFSTQFIAAAFLIFYLCRFPFRGYPEYALIAFACLQYALGVYVGRKLFYVAQMLNAIHDIKPTRNIFKDDDLGYINTYVNVLATLTVIFVYIHVTSYYNGPFEYSSELGKSARVALMLPAIIATPVLLIFNFYPRIVLRRLYSRSIGDELDRLSDRLKTQGLRDFERLSYALEYDKLWKEDLRNRLRLTLSDMPIGITIIVMIVQLILKQ